MGICLGSVRFTSTQPGPAAQNLWLLPFLDFSDTALKNVISGIPYGHRRWHFIQLGSVVELIHNMANFGHWRTGETEKSSTATSFLLLSMNGFEACFLHTAHLEKFFMVSEHIFQLLCFLWSTWRSSKHSNMLWYCFTFFLAKLPFSLHPVALVL